MVLAETRMSGEELELDGKDKLSLALSDNLKVLEEMAENYHQDRSTEIMDRTAGTLRVVRDEVLEYNNNEPDTVVVSDLLNALNFRLQRVESDVKKTELAKNLQAAITAIRYAKTELEK